MRPSLFAAHSQDSERRGLHGSGFRVRGVEDPD